MIVYLESSAPKQVNWLPSYVRSDKIPFGTYVFFDALKNQQPKVALKEINSPPYDFLSRDTTAINQTYFFLNNHISFDNSELDELLDWVDRGNTVFISSKGFNSELLDTLKLDIENNVALDEFSTQQEVVLIHPTFHSATPYHYDREGTALSFNKIDTCKTLVLGTMRLMNAKKDSINIGKQPFSTASKLSDTIQKAKVNFIKHTFGKGAILLHTFPEGFSNYFVLDKEQYTYPQNIMSYLEPETTILWDKYYKSGKKFYTSPLYILLGNKYLKSAYYLLLLGVLLFVLFEGKRKQRSIPVITPLKNQTLAFTKTISGMYFEKQQHTEIARKLQVQVLDYVREVLRVPTDHMDQQSLQHIASRSMNTIEDTKALFDYMNHITQKTTVSSEELFKLHTIIAEFKETKTNTTVS